MNDLYPTVTRGRTSRGWLVAAVAAVVAVAVALSIYFVVRPSGLPADLAAVHDATGQFRSVDNAVGAGYAQLADKEGITCIEHGDMGAMGVHYVKGDLVGDADVDAATPEAMIYEPGDDGAMELVGVEYVVFQEAWDAEHAEAPALFGHEFGAFDADNRYGIPAFYALHAWVWRDNPAGRFADYNPDVTCAHAARAHAHDHG
jgi:hypothetical protein